MSNTYLSKENSVKEVVAEIKEFAKAAIQSWRQKKKVEVIQIKLTQKHIDTKPNNHVPEREITYRLKRLGV